MNLINKLEQKYLFKPKILYFIINLQYYTFHNFRAHFAKQVFKVEDGTLGKWIGSIIFTSFFVSIFIANMSDRSGRYREFLISLIVSSCFIFLSLYLPNINQLGFFLIVAMYLFINNPKQPLLDKIMLDYLSDNNIDSRLYGKQRLYGTVSYGVSNLISESIITVPDNENYDFTNLIYYSLITTALSIVSILAFIKPKRIEKTNNSTHGITELLKCKEFMIFLSIMFLNALTRSAMSLYQPLYVKYVIKVQPYEKLPNLPEFITSFINFFNKNPISTMTLCGISFEILIMYFSDTILIKLGYFWPLLIAMCMTIVRFITYLKLDDTVEHRYIYTCCVECIKGLYFGLAHMSGVQIAKKLSPVHLRASAQMLYAGTFTALGSLISGQVFGHFFDSTIRSKDASIETKLKAYNAFFLTNTVIAIGTILFFIYKYGIKEKVLFDKKKEEILLSRYEEDAVIVNE